MEYITRGIRAAKAIRKELKNYFKNVKFSVRSDYDSVWVSWENGPSYKEVFSKIGKYDRTAYSHNSNENKNIDLTIHQVQSLVCYRN